MKPGARYDGVADWYEGIFRGSRLEELQLEAVRRLLGTGRGTVLDVGCGTGVYTEAIAQWGWAVHGVDISEDMLRYARARGLDVVHADATALPFDNDSFDAVVSMWTHTDVDDFPALTREVARVLRATGSFVYMGAHPCFVGPHSRFVEGRGVPELHPGYRSTARYAEAPGVTASGLRAKVGATHLPLGSFLQAFFDAGFCLDSFEESDEGEFPHVVALRCRR
jgi:SAM-dependent methyltransferase